MKKQCILITLTLCCKLYGATALNNLTIEQVALDTALQTDPSKAQWTSWTNPRYGFAGTNYNKIIAVYTKPFSKATAKKLADGIATIADAANKRFVKKRPLTREQRSKVDQAAQQLQSTWHDLQRINVQETAKNSFLHVLIQFFSKQVVMALEAADKAGIEVVKRAHAAAERSRKMLIRGLITLFGGPAVDNALGTPLILAHPVDSATEEKITKMLSAYATQTGKQIFRDIAKLVDQMITVQRATSTALQTRPINPETVKKAVTSQHAKALVQSPQTVMRIQRDAQKYLAESQAASDNLGVEFAQLALDMTAQLNKLVGPMIQEVNNLQKSKNGSSASALTEGRALVPPPFVSQRQKAAEKAAFRPT